MSVERWTCGRLLDTVPTGRSSKWSKASEPTISSEGLSSRWSRRTPLQGRPKSKSREASGTSGPLQDFLAEVPSEMLGEWWKRPQRRVLYPQSKRAWPRPRPVQPQMPMPVLRTNKMQRQRRSSVAGSLGSGEWQKSELFPIRGDLDGANRGNALSPTGKFLRVGFIAVVDDTRTADTFLNIGATYPNQSFTGWIPPASPLSKSSILSGIEGRRVKITGRIELYKESRRFRSMPSLSLRSSEACFPASARFPRFSFSRQIFCHVPDEARQL